MNPRTFLFFLLMLLIYAQFKTEEFREEIDQRIINFTELQRKCGEVILREEE